MPVLSCARFVEVQRNDVTGTSLRISANCWLSPAGNNTLPQNSVAVEEGGGCRTEAIQINIEADRQSRRGEHANKVFVVAARQNACGRGIHTCAEVHVTR